VSETRPAGKICGIERQATTAISMSKVGSDRDKDKNHWTIIAELLPTTKSQDGKTRRLS
jgi:hypothetical protein